jgi:UDP-glucose:(heptosyl)LPS alpha-1,3-glucosyltransferase
MTQTRPAKVALAFPGCFRRGGVERVVLETANYLALVGHEPHLFVSEWDAEALDSDVHIHRVPIDGRLPLARERLFPLRCEEVMRKTGKAFDAYGGFGVMAPPGGTTWVQSVHAKWLAICQRERRGLARWKQNLNPYHRWILALERTIFGQRQYRHLVALTEAVKQDLINHYAVPSNDVSVLPNGFSETEFNLTRRDREREACRAELGYTDKDKVVIFVANETERKGFGPLLRGIARSADPSIHLLAVGRLDPRQYRAEIERLGLNGHVQFTGPTSDVGRYYTAADVFALPTQYEAWGLVIIEAMATGLPVLTSRLAGAAVAVQPGRTGELLADSRDQDEIASRLRRLLDGQRAPAPEISASIQHYRWNNVLDQYSTILLGHHDLESPAAPPEPPADIRSTDPCSSH